MTDGWFILVFDEEPHLVAHLGMTGGIRVMYTIETEAPMPNAKYKIA